MAVFGARALSKTNAKAAKVAELKKETKVAQRDQNDDGTRRKRLALNLGRFDDDYVYEVLGMRRVARAKAKALGLAKSKAKAKAKAKRD